MTSRCDTCPANDAPHIRALAAALLAAADHEDDAATRVEIDTAAEYIDATSGLYVTTDRAALEIAQAYAAGMLATTYTNHDAARRAARAINRAAAKPARLAALLAPKP